MKKSIVKVQRADPVISVRVRGLVVDGRCTGSLSMGCTRIERCSPLPALKGFLML